MVVDAIHDELPLRAVARAISRACVSEGALGGRKTYLLKPADLHERQRRQSVGAAVRFFKLPLPALVVMHDEIDLAAGKLKVKTGGGDAGQNGLRSITATLGPGLSPRAHRHRPSRREGSRARPCAAEFLARPMRHWLVPLLTAMVEAAPLLAKDDDVGFMNKVALLTKPPARKAKSRQEKDE